MTSIDIISGFLGAGKTTFIKKLLENGKNEKTVIIENEFGEIGIDSGFLKEAGVEITEMNSGCICCSLVGDFKEALLKVCRELIPDRIIIEPSGVGKLSDVIDAVRDAESGEVRLRSATAVVDAVKCRMHMKNFGEFFVNQIENAGAIVLSHSENLSEEKLEAVVELLREHNEKAEIISTHYSLLSTDALMKAMINGRDTLEEELMEHHHHHHHEGECHCHDHEHHHHEGECHCHDHEHHHHEGECHCHDHEHHHHEGECHCHDHEHHHADEVFSSVGGETAKSFTKERTEEILAALASGEYGFVLRAKGYLKSADGFIHFDYIPEEADVRIGAAMPTGRYCVIGTELNKDKINSLWEN